LLLSCSSSSALRIGPSEGGVQLRRRPTPRRDARECVEEAAELFQNIEILWKEATPEERRRLISPLIERRVYVDMDLKLIGAITPTPAFRGLIQCAIKKSHSKVSILTDADEERLDVWSWWRRGRINLPQLQTAPVIIPHRVQPSWTALTIAWSA
jgi:hypothetical protein